MVNEMASAFGEEKFFAGIRIFRLERITSVACDKAKGMRASMTASQVRALTWL